MLSIAARLTLLTTQLRTAIGRFVVRQSRVQPVVWLGTRAYTPKPAPNQPPPLPAPVWGLFVDRLARLARRFETLYARWQTNTLPKPRPPRTRGPAAAPTTPPAAARLRLPRAFGWANRRLPEAAPPSGQLETLLHDPEAQDFVRAAPQAGRLLRPLCQALGLPQPPWLRLPPRPRRARPTPVRPMPARPAPAHRPRALIRAIQRSDRPFQPYVLAALRARPRKIG